MAPGLAVVTGASAGIGRAYAESLAGRGHPLLIVARREDRLRDLAAELTSRHGVSVTVAVCDLATTDGMAACREAIDAWAGPVDVAVLNAGIGSRGALADLPREREVGMVRLNVEAVVDLAAHVVPGMRTAGRGTIVIVSSAAAWQPLPFMATYAATKAFELSFAEALRGELRPHGVRVIAVCPGPTATEFSTGAAGAGWLRWLPQERPSGVVDATWRALDRGKAHVATGSLARLAIGAARTFPRRLVVRVAGRLGPRGNR
ncbi:MAG: SDR family oxidoreductase [Actinobacteria bacterium]|nr:SDR family oxidoreductase [Actinomycetota bacterium]